MKKHYKVALLAAVVVLTAQFAFAQFTPVIGTDSVYLTMELNNFYGFARNYAGLLEFNIPGGGARAAGMAGAHLALAEGEMAYSWNPAAMIYTDKTKLGIDFLSKSDKFKSAYIEHRFWDFRNSNITSFDLDFGHLSLNYGGFSAPFSLDSDSDIRFLAVAALPLSVIPMVMSPSEELQLSVGGGYRHIFDLEAEADIPGFDNRETTFEQNRSIDAVSLGAAAKIAEGIGFGWNMNAYVRGSEANVTIDNLLFAIWEAGGGRVDTIIFGGLQREKSTYSGFSMDFGLSADFNMIKAGAVFHTPFTLYQNMLQTRNSTFPYDIGEMDRVKIKHKMPYSASFGLALTPIEDLAIAFDYELRPLSETDITIDWEQTILKEFYNRDINAGWQDVDQYRVGAEYTVDAGFADIPLRVGFRNEPSTEEQLIANNWDITFYPDSGDVIIIEADSAFGDQVTTNIIAFGTGLEFEKIWFGIAYQFGSSSYDRRITYDYSADGGVTVESVRNQVYEIKREYSRLIFSVGMYF